MSNQANSRPNEGGSYIRDPKTGDVKKSGQAPEKTKKDAK